MSKTLNYNEYELTYFDKPLSYGLTNGQSGEQYEIKKHSEMSDQDFNRVVKIRFNSNPFEKEYTDQFKSIMIGVSNPEDDSLKPNRLILENDQQNGLYTIKSYFYDSEFDTLISTSKFKDIMEFPLENYMVEDMIPDWEYPSDEDYDIFYDCLSYYLKPTIKIPYNKIDLFSFDINNVYGIRLTGPNIFMVNGRLNDNTIITVGKGESPKNATIFYKLGINNGTYFSTQLLTGNNDTSDNWENCLSTFNEKLPNIILYGANNRLVPYTPTCYDEQGEQVLNNYKNQLIFEMIE